MSNLKPLAVYDARESSWPPANLEEVQRWLRGLGVEPNDTYRIEIYLLDCLFARVYQYDKDERGKSYCPRDHEHMAVAHVYGLCEIALRDPFNVLIPEMPPV